jgi:nicotinate-nucleotide adenylyltransferase
LQADANPPEAAPSTGYGVFGGVFDPVHRDHVAAATAALAELPISEVRFIPAGIPPHKTEGVQATAIHRLRLLELAIEGEPRFVLDRRELDRPGPSYTVLTLQELTAERPGERIFFLIGADNARSIGRWHRAQEIFELCDPVLVPRPGHPERFTPNDLPFLSESRLVALDRLTLSGVCLDRSSSEIRRRVRDGDSIDGMVPEGVAEYIEKHGLYR